MTENKKNLLETSAIKDVDKSVERTNKGYSLYIDKVGSLTEAVDRLRTDMKMDDRFITNLMLEPTVPHADLPKLKEVVLANISEFNEHFILSIINTENEKRLTKKFDDYNNLKQLILLVSLYKGLAISSIRSTSSTFRSIEELESEFHKPFWSFDKREVKKAYIEMAKKGYSAHTIVSKVSLLIKAEDTLRELVKSSSTSQINLGEENEWYKSAHAPREKKTSDVIHKTGRFFYTKDIIYRGLEVDLAENAVVPLLIFRGVKLPLPDGSQNEIGEIKISDFDGNVLNVRGEYPRRITFTDYEMKFIKRLFVGAKPSDYLLRPKYRSRHDRKPVPLKRWAIVERRLKRVGEALNIPMNYYPIRQSGELYFVDKYLQRYAPQKVRGSRPIKITKYVDNEERDMMIEALTKCFEQFGIVHHNEVTKEDFSRSPNQERMLTFLSLRKRFEVAREKQKLNPENK